MNNIKKSSKNTHKNIHNECTYKLLKNEFAKSTKPPPVKLYNILEIKMNTNKQCSNIVYK